MDDAIPRAGTAYGAVAVTGNITVPAARTRHSAFIAHVDHALARSGALCRASSTAYETAGSGSGTLQAAVPDAVDEAVPAGRAYAFISPALARSFAVTTRTADSGGPDRSQGHGSRPRKE